MASKAGGWICIVAAIILLVVAVFVMIWAAKENKTQELTNYKSVDFWMWVIPIIGFVILLVVGIIILHKAKSQSGSVTSPATGGWICIAAGAVLLVIAILVMIWAAKNNNISQLTNFHSPDFWVWVICLIGFVVLLVVGIILLHKAKKIKLQRQREMEDEYYQ